MSEERIFRKGLGRLIAPDANDKRYPMAAALRPTKLPSVRYYTAPSQLPLDQGETGTCVAHAWTAFLLCAPLMCKDPMHPYKLYRKIVVADEFADNDYEAHLTNDRELNFGTSVRAGAKVLQGIGHVKSYVWARSADEAAIWLLSGKGTVVLGTDWCWDMGTPDRKGFVSLTGGSAGGHAYLAIGYSRVEMAFRCLNSWGREYGANGRFWIRHRDMNELIRTRDGEACAATEQLVLPVA